MVRRIRRMPMPSSTSSCAEAGAAIASFIQYATPNEAARALMPAEYTGNPAIFPPDEVIAQSEPAVYQGTEYMQLIDRLWTRIAAACSASRGWGERAMAGWRRNPAVVGRSEGRRVGRGWGGSG